MLENLEQDSFFEVFLLAPFFAPDASALQKIADQVTISRIQIALQKDNHNLIDLTPYTEFSTGHGIPCDIVEAAFKDDYTRTFHSKILYLKGKEEHLLIGSPNMTRSALLEPNRGNVECAVIFKESGRRSSVESREASRRYQHAPFIRRGVRNPTGLRCA